MPRPQRLIAVVFVVSGATGLAAQVVLNRLLGYVFGASHLATATILAAYMGGLSLGALTLGRLSTRSRRPIRVYGILELGVAVVFVLTPHVYASYRSLAVDLARAVSGDPTALTFVRFAISCAFVLVPTTLMGGTLPLLVAAFKGPRSLSEKLPWLYALNTLGAAAGTLLTGYFGIVALGLDGTLYLCAALNAAVGCIALLVSRRLPPRMDAEEAPPPAGRVAAPATLALLPRIVIILSLLQGTLTFALEVVWSHLVRTVLGVTVHAYVLMLASILLGIGLGSLLIPRVARRTRLGPLQLFVASEVAMSACLAVSLLLWDRFPTLVNATTWLKPTWSYWQRELMRFGWSTLLMLPASLAMGVALPSLAASLRCPADHAAGRWVGAVFAANTLGAIIGSLVTGFFLLGRVESSLLLRGAALLLLGSAAVAALPGGWASLGRSVGQRRVVGAAAALSVAALLVFPGWDARRLTAGSHYYWSPWEASREEIRFLREDAQSGFVSVHETPGRRILKTNGKYEGSDAPQEFQDDMALIGGLYPPRLQHAALLGLGPGRTLAILHDMPFRVIDAFEFSPAIIDAARSEFPGFTRDVLADEGRVSLVVDDGRNRLQASRQRYDFIVVGITGAAFAGSGAIYSRDFFEVLRDRLAPGGAVSLWLQLHHVPARDVRSVLATLRTVFPYLHVYTTPAADQAYLIASITPLTIDARRAADLATRPRIRSILGARGMRSLLELAALCVFSSDAELQRYLAAGERPPDLLTDLRPLFEYRVPVGLALDIRSHDLQRFSDLRLPPIDPPPDEGLELGLQGLRSLYGHRYERALEAFDRSRQLLGESAWREASTRARFFVDQRRSRAR